MSEETQRRLQSEVDNFKTLQKELQKVIENRQQLDAQLNENLTVQEEFNLLKAEAVIYKSVGPILIKTELVEAKQNVSKRIEFIKKEITRCDSQIMDIEKKQDLHKEKIQKLQAQMQQVRV